MLTSLVQVQHVDGLWPHVKDGFQKALLKTGGDLALGSLWQQCRAGEAFLVVVHDDGVMAAAIVRPELWATGNKLRVLALYGEGMGDWFQDIMDMGKRIAADCGANALIFEGRRGWSKKFPRARILRVLYEEPLEPIPTLAVDDIPNGANGDA